MKLIYAIVMFLPRVIWAMILVIWMFIYPEYFLKQNEEINDGD